MLDGAKLLRRSILPSLLAARYTNQSHAIRNAQLYEIANVVLPSQQADQLPKEQSTLGIVTSGDLRLVRGIVESLLAQMHKDLTVQWQSADHSMFQSGTAQRLAIKGKTVGWVGLCSEKFLNLMNLDAVCGIAELDVDAMTESLVEVRRADPYSPFPAVERDLNFVVDETLLWSSLEQQCRQVAGPLLTSVQYRETYRDTKKDGEGKKRTLLSLQFQSMDRTLTGEDVDQAIAKVIQACAEKFSAKLLS